MIKQIIDEITATSGTNAKMNVLREYKDNILLKRILYMTYSKRIKYFIKQIPEYVSQPINDGSYTLEQMVIKIEAISNRELTGNVAREYLKVMLEGSQPDDAYIIQCMIEKSLKIGMGTRNINKVFPKLIEKTGYLGAKSYSDKLVKNILKSNPVNFSQEKIDGRYLNTIIRASETELCSRQGEPTILYGAKFLKELESFEDCVLNGELTMDSPNEKIILKMSDKIKVDGIIYYYDEFINNFITIKNINNNLT